MKIAINPHSEVPIHLQLREQIIMGISNGELPIGKEMRSERDLARQLGIHHNTVSRVYGELVKEKWLFRPARGASLVVMERSKQSSAAEFKDLEDLISRTIRVAQQRGYSLQELADRVRERLQQEPPDHLLIVEPERGMGELMREEIRQKTGRSVPVCTIYMLQQNPNLATGAVLLTPLNLEAGLECIPARNRHLVSLKYLTPEPHFARIRSLSEPSAVGMVSISEAALRTAGGLLHAAAGKRHSVHQFLMQWPVGAEGPRFTPFSMEEYHPPAHLRDFQTTSQKLRHQASMDRRRAASVRDVHKYNGKVPLLSGADLKFIDLLFCDTIAYLFVKHPNSVPSQLLSDESLQEIASVAKGLPGTRKLARAAAV
jgi:DNA-binding transcriptional regulator YhcF (GntR family)